MAAPALLPEWDQGWGAAWRAGWQSERAWLQARNSLIISSTAIVTQPAWCRRAATRLPFPITAPWVVLISAYRMEARGTTAREGAAATTGHRTRRRRNAALCMTFGSAMSTQL